MKDHKIDDADLENVSGGQSLDHLAPQPPQSTPPSGTDEIDKVDSPPGGGNSEPDTPDLPGGTPDTGDGNTPITNLG